MKTAVLLFAHGARDARWAAPFEAVAAKLRVMRGDAIVRLAYLEFMQPDLATAATELAAAGCGRVEVVPLFLGAGGHVRNDVPLLLDGLRARHAGVDFRLHPAIGEHALVIDAIAAAAGLTLETPPG